MEAKKVTLSVHKNIAAAVKAVNFDLSYNEREGLRAIKLLDEGGCVSHVFTSEEGKIFYFYHYKNDVLLNEFYPFMSALYGSGFSTGCMFIDGDTATTVGYEAPKTVSRKNAARETAAMQPFQDAMPDDICRVCYMYQATPIFHGAGTAI
tara:strand:- start:2598 stop:3047 length:450 start_codon:yes stop_codon:yes gene_type:complete